MLTWSHPLDPARLGARLRAYAGEERSDADGNGDWALPPLREPAHRLAAVLIAILNRAAPPDDRGPTILFTRRTAHLSAHAGQISFPGGRIEPYDESVAAAALREAWEETGLDPGRVEVLGQLPLYQTRTGFQVTPVVGLVAPGFTLKPDPAEVDEAFEVPLAYLMAPASAQRAAGELAGVSRSFWAFPYGGHYIWGATAGMLMSLRAALGVALPPESAAAS